MSEIRIATYPDCSPKEVYASEEIAASELWSIVESLPNEMDVLAFREAWDAWLAARQRNGWPQMTAKSLVKCLARLTDRVRQHGIDTAVADLHATIAKGWDNRIYCEFVPETLSSLQSSS